MSKPSIGTVGQVVSNIGMIHSHLTDELAGSIDEQTPDNTADIN
jgi:hypothetical protein